MNEQDKAKLREEFMNDRKLVSINPLDQKFVGASPKMVADYFLSKFEALMQKKVEEIGRFDFELTPLEESVKAGWTELEANRIEAKGEGYKQALQDVLTLFNPHPHE